MTININHPCSAYDRELTTVINALAVMASLSEASVITPVDAYTARRCISFLFEAFPGYKERLAKGAFPEHNASGDAFLDFLAEDVKESRGVVTGDITPKAEPFTSEMEEDNDEIQS